MQEELTVRVEHPELPAIRWNEAEVQQNLTEMLAAYTGRSCGDHRCRWSALHGEFWRRAQLHLPQGHRC